MGVEIVIPADIQKWMEHLDNIKPEPFVTVTVHTSGKVSLGKPMTTTEFNDRVFNVTIGVAVLTVLFAIMFAIVSAVRRDRLHVDEDRRFAAACSALGGVTHETPGPIDRSVPPFRCFRQGDIIAVAAFKVGP